MFEEIKTQLHELQERAEKQFLARFLPVFMKYCISYTEGHGALFLNFEIWNDAPETDQHGNLFTLVKDETLEKYGFNRETMNAEITPALNALHEFHELFQCWPGIEIKPIPDDSENTGHVGESGDWETSLEQIDCGHWVMDTEHQVIPIGEKFACLACGSDSEKHDQIKNRGRK